MDSATDLEASAVRQAAARAICVRVRESVAGWLTDRMCMQVAICASMRTCDELLSFLLKAHVARGAVAASKTLLLSPSEWDALFGHQASPCQTSPLADVRADPRFVHSCGRVQSALRCTVGESGQGALWQRPLTKAACALAMHMDRYEEFITSSLGNVVRADLRRLEDLRCTMEDEGVDVVLVAQLVQALADCVV